MFSALVTHLTNSRSSQRGRKKILLVFPYNILIGETAVYAISPLIIWYQLSQMVMNYFLFFYSFIFMHIFYIKNFLRLASNMVWINLNHWVMCYMCMVML